MTKELQNYVWSILPKEFKEEVKKLAQYYSRHVSALFGMERQRADKFYCEFVSLFGKHNLTSDAEGEEMLTVPRNKVQELYAKAKDIYDLYTNATCINSLESHAIDISTGKMKILDTLFGSKCLPDAPSSEPKFKVGDNVVLKQTGKIKMVVNVENNGRYAVATPFGQSPLWVDESDLEPYTEPTETFTDTCQSQCKSQEESDRDLCNKLIQRGFKNHNRLHIAAQMMQGLICAPIVPGADPNLSAEYLAQTAFRLADALIAEAEKGGDK